MTRQQFYWLRWFAKHGECGRVEGRQLIMADKSRSGGEPLVCFLHLLADGCLIGQGGSLYLTDHGRRCIERTETGELPFDDPPSPGSP